MSRVRIGFLLPHYSQKSRSFMPDVVRALGDSGALVDVIHPVDSTVDLSKVRVEHDLYVLRHTSGLSLSLAGALHQLGAAIVNPYPVSAALRDKVIASRVLQSAEVRTPDTYVASHPAQLLPLLDSGPIVIKPYQGTGGHHVRVIRTAAELAGVDCGCEPVFAQRYHFNDGRDRKIYSIGGHLFGVKKVFPRRTEEEKQGEPFALTPELCEIAGKCGRAFGIDLYGVDIIESEGTPYVVDMCSIPGFKGVPDAPQLLARYFYEAAERVARGERLDPDASVAKTTDLTHAAKHEGLTCRALPVGQSESLSHNDFRFVDVVSSSDV
jgi:ribosomal protein S6--L-glutamate ligase